MVTRHNSLKASTIESRREMRQLALQMASTQVAPHRYPAGEGPHAAEDVVRMASTYFKWLADARIPAARRK